MKDISRWAGSSENFIIGTSTGTNVHVISAGMIKTICTAPRCASIQITALR